MKKILIISYFYPPSNFVGGERTQFWAENLNKVGYYPIILTRTWDKNQTDITITPKENLSYCKKYENHEVHYIRKKKILRDYFSKGKISLIIRKIFTFINQILIHADAKNINFHNFIKYSEKSLNLETIDLIIASGRPFEAFAIAQKISIKHKIPWIADYRDEWTSNFRKKTRNPFELFLRNLEKKSEIKWTKSAHSFITVSEKWGIRIQKINLKKFEIIKNGYSKIIQYEKLEKDFIQLTYVGTLYPYQDLSLLFSSLKKLEEMKFKVKLTFIGSNDDSRLKELILLHHVKEVEILPRLPKEKVIEILKKTDFGILIKYNNLDGCIPVKLYDYISTSTPVLLFQSDNDLMAEIINGSIGSHIIESVEDLKNVIYNYRENRYSLRLETSITLYSREYQTKLLAKYISTIIG